MIAILGAGDFGLAMGHAIGRTGQRFCFGVRDVEAVAASVDAIQKLDGLKTCVGASGIDAAVRKADLVILAIPYGAAAPLVQSIPDWGGRIVVDCTNPLKAGLTGLEVGHNNSAAEEIARHAANANVVKAFSTLSAYVLEHPTFGTGRAFLPVCGDDADARARYRTGSSDGIRCGGHRPSCPRALHRTLRHARHSTGRAAALRAWLRAGRASA